MDQSKHLSEPLITSPARPRTELILIRHGESQSMVRRVIGGHHGDTGLTDSGKQQAAAYCNRLLRTSELKHATFFVSSLMPRAIETAEIIAPGIGSGNLPLNRLCDLCELHPGEADGLTEADWIARYGRPNWAVDLDAPFAPGGESLLGFYRRAIQALRSLADAHPSETIVAVCHSGIIEASMVEFLGLQFGYRAVGLMPLCTSITRWSRPVDDLHKMVRWRLDTYNDSAHLASNRPGYEE